MAELKELWKGTECAIVEAGSEAESVMAGLGYAPNEKKSAAEAETEESTAEGGESIASPKRGRKGK